MKRISILSILAVMLLLISIGAVSAFGGKFNGLVDRYEAMSDMREHKGEMIQAIEDGNYEAFKLAAENLPRLSHIDSEEKFELLVLLHQAKRDGNYDTVEELREELGLPGGFGKPGMSE